MLQLLLETLFSAVMHLKMIGFGLEEDAVIFNTLLHGCVQKAIEPWVTSTLPRWSTSTFRSGLQAHLWIEAARPESTSAQTVSLVG